MSGTSAPTFTTKELEGISIVEITLDREDEGELVFISCKQIDQLFIAAKKDDDIRAALDKGLKNAFEAEVSRVQVFPNGKIDGPRIDVLVKLTA